MKNINKIALFYNNLRDYYLSKKFIKMTKSAVLGIKMTAKGKNGEFFGKNLL